MSNNNKAATAMKEIHSMMKPTATLLNSIQKLIVYETLTNFYIVGSNESESVNRIVRINRISDISTLSIIEDQNVYDKNQLKDHLTKIIADNLAETKINPMITNQQSYPKKYFAHGLLGFVRFTEGYYMLLVTKHSPVAVLGYNLIYTIEDTAMIYIPNNSYDKYQLANQIKEPNLDEQKYLKMFTSIDLKQNFYYSYSYDLTNTLQHNQLALMNLSSETNGNTNSNSNNHLIYGLKNKPAMKYVWNQYLLKPTMQKLSYHWLIYIIHGFLAQSSINVFGCTVFITLISRRSQKYAGTRFLKRGGNNQGYVANEVETEQIVHKASVSSLKKGFYTSFVHVRGSIPLFWSQDPKAVPKPPINIDIVDPFAIVASRHFKQLLSRFGAPLIILNLVKLREKRAQESILAVEYESCIDYVKQFLPDKNYIEYLCLDMAKLNKTEKGNVMNKIYEIAESCIRKTKFYQNFKPIYENPYSSLSFKDYNFNPEFNNLSLSDESKQQLKQKLKQQQQQSDDLNFVRQTGVMRVNCVDCLDRTNTAMFVVGKCALAHQLYALGIIPYPNLGQDSVCERMLIELYEKSGDAIAQQYAGSQLVHRVDTYGKNSLASQSRDMIHTISRYYSNTFADADKQNSINVFLGVFQPFNSQINLWEMPTDIYLHDSFIMNPWRLATKKYLDWIESPVFRCLPRSYDQASFLDSNKFIAIEKLKESTDYRINKYDYFYRSSQLIAFHEIFYFNNSIRNIASNSSSSLSIGGNLRAIILDPFNMRSKKAKSDAANSSSQYSSSGILSSSEKPGNLSATSMGSSESDSDDTFSSYDIVSKALNNNRSPKDNEASNYNNNNNNNQSSNKYGSLKSSNETRTSLFDRQAAYSGADYIIKLDINESKLNDYRRYINLSNNDAAKSINNNNKNNNQSMKLKQQYQSNKQRESSLEKSYVIVGDSTITASDNNNAMTTMTISSEHHPISPSKSNNKLNEANLCKSNREVVNRNLKTNYFYITTSLPDYKLNNYKEFLSKASKLESVAVNNFSTIINTTTSGNSSSSSGSNKPVDNLLGVCSSSQQIVDYYEKFIARYQSAASKQLD